MVDFGLTYYAGPHTQVYAYRPCKVCGGPNYRHTQAASCRACLRLCERVRQRAHTAVAQAIRIGDIPPPSSAPCADCGGPATDYDHRYYARPLAVDPTCRRCNVRRGNAHDLFDMARLEAA